MEDKLVELGFCAKAHGVTGGFSFHLSDQENSILEAGMEILLTPRTDQSSIPKEGLKMVIEKISFGNKVIVYLEGVSSKNQVDEMVPFSINVYRSQFPAPSEGEYYITDLEGLDVIDFNSGKKVGYVSGTYDNGVQSIIVVRGDRKIWELPFVENFFPDVDLEKKCVYMIVPEVINAY